FVMPGDRLKVMDFGVAILKTDRKTLAGFMGLQTHNIELALGYAPNVAGTPLYMAPEQLMGKTQGPRTDLWAFGIVLFEMLTAQRPFTAPQHILTKQPPSLKALREDITDGLLRVVAACLCKQPQDRPRSAADVVQMLEQLHARPVQVPLRTPRTNIKPSSDAFVGRQAEQAALSDMLDGGDRLLTVLGPGGCGKTRLAREFALAHQERFERVVFCDLVEAKTLDGIAVAVGHALDVPLSQKDPLEQLGFAIAGQGRALVILDNFE
ncbi:MAG: AAA family ATPase, partial [Myxococcota bacterium]